MSIPRWTRLWVSLLAGVCLVTSVATTTATHTLTVQPATGSGKVTSGAEAVFERTVVVLPDGSRTVRWVLRTTDPVAPSTTSGDKLATTSSTSSPLTSSTQVASGSTTQTGSTVVPLPKKGLVVRSSTQTSTAVAGSVPTGTTSTSDSSLLTDGGETTESLVTASGGTTDDSKNGGGDSYESDRSGRVGSAWKPNRSGGGGSGTPPLPPTGIFVQDAGNGGEIILSWSDASTDTTGSKIERQTRSGVLWGAMTEFMVAPTVRSFADFPGNGTFRYRVAAVNTLGASAFTDWAEVTVTSAIPIAPGNLQVTGPIPRVSWYDNATNESGFEVQRETQSAGSWVAPTTFRAALNAAGYTDAPPTGTYRYKVRSFNTSGASAWVGPVSISVVEVPPAAPTGLSRLGLGNGQQPLLGWTDVSANESSFEISRERQSGTVWDQPATLTVGANVTTYSDEPGAGTFRYRVRALNSAGASAWTVYLTVVTTEIPPQAPSGLQASDLGNGSQTLSVWTDNSLNESGFQLVREEQAGSTWVNTTTINIPVNTATYTDAPGVGAFRYRVRAVNSAGASDWTSWVTPTVSPIVPDAPSNLTAVDLGNGADVRATWTDNSANEAGFELTRQTQSGANWVDTVTMTTGANVSTWVDSPGVGTHRYQARAVNAAGASAATAWVVVPVAPTIPNAPSDLSAADAGDALHASVTWSDNSSNEQSFEIVQEKQSGTSWGNATAITVGANVTSYMAEPGVGTFRYKIRATNSAGSSAYTPWYNVTISMPPPEAPTDLAVVDLADGLRTRATWTDNSSNETGFELLRETQSGANWVSPATVTVAANTATYTDSPGPGTYRYKVRSVNAGGGSAFTPYFTVTVAGKPPTPPTGLQASDAGNRRALLSWVDTTSGAASFQIERTPAFAGGSVSVGAGVTGYLDQCGAGSFSYRVRAVNSYGVSAFTGWVAVNVADTVPAAPSGLTVSDLGNQSQCRLAWVDNSDNESSFVIQRETQQSGGTWGGSVSYTLGANATLYTDNPGLGTFRYRVAATNQVGWSSWTAYVAVSISGGWTAFNPSADSRLVFVSSSAGNDSNSGLTSGAPKKTLAAAYGLLRSGYPDWLQLKAGEVWYESMPTWNKSGRSATEPMLVTSYGTGARPELRTGSSQGMGSSTININFVAFVGLHFNAHTWTGATAGGPVGVNLTSAGGTWLIEDCLIERYANNLIIQGYPTRANGIRLRRNIFWNPMRTDAGNTNMYIDYVDGLVLEENLCVNLKSNDSLTNAAGTKMSHHAYLHQSCGPVTLIGNIGYNSRTNWSARPGGYVRDNLSIRGGQGFQIGYQDYRASTVVGNVCTETRDHWNGQSLGQAFVFSLNNGTVVSHNVVANSTDGMDCYAMWIDPDCMKMDIKYNVSYNWWMNQGDPPLIFLVGTAIGPITILNNDWQQTHSKNCMKFATTPGSWISFANNRYFTARSNIVSDASQSYTISNWQAAKEPTASYLQVNYPDPGRTVGSYNATLGGSPDTEAFLIEARNNSRSNWRPQYTAHGVNEYIRAGFGVVLPPN